MRKNYDLVFDVIIGEVVFFIFLIASSFNTTKKRTRRVSRNLKARLKKKAIQQNNVFTVVRPGSQNPK